MQRLKSIGELNSSCIMTIGNFDGLHRGHQKFLGKMLKFSKEKNLKVLVITFIPHPVIFFKKRDSLLINTYEERKILLENFGIDYLLELEFNKSFSELSQNDFLNRYCKSKHIKGIFLGHDFSFGESRKGTHKDIEDFCLREKLFFFQDEMFQIQGSDLSSSQVRSALLDADLKMAMLLLGRKFFLEGTIIKGEGKGRTLAFATINLEVFKERIIPKRGVYHTNTVLDDKRVFKSITNIGFKPTISDKKSLSIETHILDFDADLYGEKVRIEFLAFVRDERKFKTIDELKLQIIDDVYARKILSDW